MIVVITMMIMTIIQNLAQYITLFIHGTQNENERTRGMRKP